MSTTTPEKPKRFRVARQPYYTGGGERHEYATESSLLQLGDVVELADGNGPDPEGDVTVVVVRHGLQAYVAVDALDPVDERPAISEADVEAFVESIGIEVETVEVPAILEALVGLGMRPELAEAAVALAQRRSR